MQDTTKSSNAKAHLQDRPYNDGNRTQTLNESEAAQMFALKTSTLQKWRWLGKGPKYLKLGRRVVYRLQDLEDFMEKHAVNPRKEVG